MRFVLKDIVGEHLARATPAMQLCARIVEVWEHEPVTLDFEGVVRLSPSFANALFLNLLHRCTDRELTQRVSFENTSPHIAEAIDTAIKRKTEHNVELSSYELEPAGHAPTSR